MQVPCLLVDHDAGPGSERLHVEVRVLRELPLHSRAGVERPDVAGPVALGEVVDGAVHPDRVQLALAFPRRGRAVPGSRRYDADRLGLSAPVVAPLGVEVADLLVRHVGAVRGHSAAMRLGQGERSRESARRRNRIEPRAHRRRRLPVRLEENGAVRRPSLDEVRGRVPGQALGLASRRGDQVDVGIAFVLPGEGDPLPVGAERGIDFGSFGAGQADGPAAVAPHRPEVVGMHERRCATRSRRADAGSGPPARGRQPFRQRSRASGIRRAEPGMGERCHCGTWIDSFAPSAGAPSAGAHLPIRPRRRRRRGSPAGQGWASGSESFRGVQLRASPGVLWYDGARRQQPGGSTS